MSWLKRLKSGLQKTRDQLVSNLERVVGAHRRIDQELLEELEEVLVLGDVGMTTTTELIDALKARVKQDGLDDPAQVIPVFRQVITERLKQHEGELNLRADRLSVILMLGVNGSGKTTTIAKLAQRFKDEGRRPVTLAAGDTFRAAAIEQLEIWAQRLDADFVRHQHGADPSAVAYDAIAHAEKAGGVLLIDTAGRLQTNDNLMEELKKVNRVVEKRLGRPADERLLVLDATTGQNALSQAQKFNEAVPLTGLVVTKLDSTAKGGSVLTVTSQLELPVKFIGVGERAEDLQPFKAEEFVEALF